MPISPLEIMRGSILVHEGKLKKVRAIGDFIQFEGTKEWIGGSLVMGEPLSNIWLLKLGFTEMEDHFYWADPSCPRLIYIARVGDGPCWNVRYAASNKEPCILRAISFVHELQIIFFGVIGEYLITPKKL